MPGENESTGDIARIYDKLEAMDKRWDDRFDEFKTEFDIRMYKGNGKPAVMDSIKEHDNAIEDLRIGITSAKNQALKAEETACSQVKDLKDKIQPMLDKQEEVSWAKKHWKLIAVLVFFSIVIIGTIIAAFLWITSKLPELRPLIIEILKAIK